MKIRYIAEDFFQLAGRQDRGESDSKSVGRARAHKFKDFLEIRTACCR